MGKITKALVTGGAGFIGSHIVDELLKRGIETIVLDDLSTGDLSNIHKLIESRLIKFVRGDISEISSIFQKEENFDIVFHKAAIVSVQQSVNNPVSVFNSNVNSAFKVLNFCKDSGVKKIIFASSAAVYGDLQGQELSEKTYCYPTSPYGASKIAIEHFLHSYWKTYGLKTVSLRYFNVYGPRQSNNEYSGVIAIFIRKILENKPLEIFGDGKQTRDFVNIRDVVNANMLAMESSNASGEVFNIASGSQTTILNLAELVKKTTSKENIPVKFSKARTGDIRQSIANISKSKEILGYNPTTNLHSGLSDYLNSQKLL